MTPRRIADLVDLVYRNCVMCGKTLKDHTADEAAECVDRALRPADDATDSRESRMERQLVGAFSVIRWLSQSPDNPPGSWAYDAANKWLDRNQAFNDLEVPVEMVNRPDVPVDDVSPDGLHGAQGEPETGPQETDRPSIPRAGSLHETQTSGEAPWVCENGCNHRWPSGCGNATLNAPCRCSCHAIPGLSNGHPSDEPSPYPGTEQGPDAPYWETPAQVIGYLYDALCLAYPYHRNHTTCNPDECKDAAVGRTLAFASDWLRAHPEAKAVPTARTIVPAVPDLHCPNCAEVVDETVRACERCGQLFSVEPTGDSASGDDKLRQALELLAYLAHGGKTHSCEEWCEQVQSFLATFPSNTARPEGVQE